MITLPLVKDSTELKGASMNVKSTCGGLNIKIYSPKKRKPLLVSLLFILVFLTFGCKKVTKSLGISQEDSVTIVADSTAPTIVSVYPSADSIDVSSDTNITVTFSEAILEDSLGISSSTTSSTPLLVKYEPNTLIDVTQKVDPDKKIVTIDPTNDLTPGTRYTVVVSTGIKDLQGNALASEYVWSFTTKKCSGTANYTVTFNSTWSSSTHPTDFPTSPHFSGLIGGTHNGNVSFWGEGKVASQGVESMAETGSKTALSNAITTSINSGDAKSILSGGGIGSSPGSVSLVLDVSSQYSKITLVSMVAPSPDWFVGVSGLDLCEKGEWITTKTVDLFAYDSGTDSGTTFTSNNSDTNPKEKITKLTSGIFKVNGLVPALGTFTFLKN